MTMMYDELVDDLREKYLKVRKMLDEPRDKHPEGPDCETKNEAISILKEMKIKLENFSNNSHEYELKITSMLAIVLLNIGIILIDNEELKEAEENLMHCIEILKNYELEPECILIALSTLNQLGIIWFQWSEYEKAMAFVKKSESTYENFKCVKPTVEPIGMSQLFGIKNSDEPCPNHVLEKLHTLTLYYIAQIHGTSKDHEKAAFYCHMTLERQLEFDDLDYIDWALNAATLSQLFMERKNFPQARHHLAASSHILKLYENSLTDENNENDEVQSAKWEQFRHRYSDVARCWAKYGILLLSMSRDRLLELADNLDNEKPSVVNNDTKMIKDNSDIDLINNMSFKKLEEHIKPIAEQITDKYLLDFSDARLVFLNVQKWLDEAKKYYALNTHASDYVHIVQDMSQAYKYLAFFEGNEDNQAKMHKRRIDILEQVIGEINPRYYQSECRQIWIELAETFSAILEIKLDKLRATDDRPTPHALTKINQMCRSSIKYYQMFLDSLKPNESAPAVKEFSDEMLRPALLAYFHLGTLYNKLIMPDVNAQIDNVKKSIDAYNFFVEYCETHADAAEFMKIELSVCKDFAKLLPLKLSKLRRIVATP
ncbi:hypothetical protein PV325_005985 [Microctonus aethiopoides]|uniref:KIF-binding protein n=1 Tax=Microctonus aethiopoides TaxID=144406 RepID=A0AA39FJU2_9HYME|nr:hypothetical protein PV325_005985 [Microctonus aethiopoides]KAK0170924.1 hypothetical protein PV328_008702 [Microctonus aethiopoides]